MIVGSLREFSRGNTAGRKEACPTKAYKVPPRLSPTASKFSKVTQTATAGSGMKELKGRGYPQKRRNLTYYLTRILGS